MKIQIDANTVVRMATINPSSKTSGTVPICQSESRKFRNPDQISVPIWGWLMAPAGKLPLEIQDPARVRSAQNQIPYSTDVPIQAPAAIHPRL